MAQSQTAQDVRYFSYDESAVEKLLLEKPWETNPKYFLTCRVSALAAMKMLKHAVAGVEKGTQETGVPLEIMGLMIGKVMDRSIVITDVAPLPVTGTETRVVADDAQMHMIGLLESLEKRRKDKFIGWYHSHPFEVETYSHCHLSNTDVLTQQNWQMTSPTWIAIVIDPLRSLAKQEPEMGAYRVYPPRYTPPINESPNGLVLDEDLRIQRWGHSHNRYYELGIEYFVGELSSKLLDVMSRKNLWMRMLSSSTLLHQEQRDRYADRILKATERLSGSELAVFTSLRAEGKRKYEELDKSAQATSDVAIEQCKGHATQLVKDLLFNVKFVDEKVENEM